MSAFGGKPVVPNTGQFPNQKGSGFGDRRNNNSTYSNNKGSSSSGGSGNGPNRKKPFNKNGTSAATQKGFKPGKSNGNDASGNAKGNKGALPKNRKRNDKRPVNGKYQEQSTDMEVVEMEVVDTLPKPRVIPRSNLAVQNHEPQIVQLTGTLVPNAESLGFRPKKVLPREVPKYLQVQPRLISPIPFTQDSWDKQNQDKMNQMEAQNNGNDFQGLYEEFQKMRDIERKKMEDLGLVDAENIRKDLNDAISFQGTCLDMCPTFERVRRALENNVKKLEKDPVTNKISKDMAVKAFSRPAAGQPPPLPSEVRPPFVLAKTLDYLIENIVPQLPEAHSFIWDRTRSIRQDFTYQNYYGPEAIDCNEKIVRIHLICLHIMAGSDVEHSQQQELEQFNKALQTLMEIYQDVRNHGGYCPNEPEFRAYYLLSHLRESEVEREIQNLPSYILQDNLVQLAIKIRNITSQNNLVERGFKNSIGGFNLFVEFFRLVYHETTPFLISCLLETQFNEIRFYAIKAMTRSYHTKGKAYDGETMRAMLGFDSVDELVKYLQYYEIDIINDNGVILIDLVNREKLESKYKINSMHEKPRLAQPYSKQLDKKINRKYAEFIKSGKPNDNLHLKNVDDLRILEQNRQQPPEVKAGSLADFLSKPASSGVTTGTNGFSGFGSGSAPSSGFGSGTSGFGTVPSHVVQQSAPTPSPSFSFGNSEPPKTSEGFTEPQKKPTEKVSPPVSLSVGNKDDAASKKVPFSFNSTTPATASGGLLGPATTKPPRIQEIKPEESKAPPSFSIPKLPSTAESKPVPVAQPAKLAVPKPVTAPKKLVDAPLFEQASRDIVESVLSQTIDEELEKHLRKLVKHENNRRERSRIINLFGTELYDAFISEIIFKSLLENKAAHHYNKTLKLKYIKKVKAVGEKYQKRQQLRRKRQEELSEIKFGSLNGLKRQLSAASSVSSKRRRVWDETSIDEIVDKRNEIERLWEPVDLRQFVDRLNANLSINISVDKIDIKCLVLIENFKLNYSRWLVNKLNMKANKEKGVYETPKIESDKIDLELLSLPERSKLNKEFFKNIPFVIFECGLLSEDDLKKFSDINVKLKRDSMILKKIVEFLHKYSDYKMQILLVYWDVTGAKLTPDTIEKGLGIDAFKKQFPETIKQVIISDMSGAGINATINEGMNNLSNNFNGDLSARGEKKRSKRKLDSGDMDNVKSKISNDKFKKNEIQMLKKAKLDKKYSYLNNHSIVNQSINQSNQSLLNPNWNRTIGNRTLDMNRTFNRTNNSTMLDSTIINTSNLGLGQFGREIIEESTPFNSPKKPATDTPISSSKPTFSAPKRVSSTGTERPMAKNLQQLIDLTTKIKSKYKP